MTRTTPTPSYADFFQRSLNDRDGFWAEQAQLVEWQTPPQQICDYSNPPFARWFVGGTTNLCHNAVDRHLATRADQNALIFVSTETGTERCHSFRELPALLDALADAPDGLSDAIRARFDIALGEVAAKGTGGRK